MMCCFCIAVFRTKCFVGPCLTLYTRATVSQESPSGGGPQNVWPPLGVEIDDSITEYVWSVFVGPCLMLHTRATVSQESPCRNRLQGGGPLNFAPPLGVERIPKGGTEYQKVVQDTSVCCMVSVLLYHFCIDVTFLYTVSFL